MDAGDEGRVYAFGDYRLDAGAQLLHSTSGAPPVSLTRRVFATLFFLVEHPGVVVDKDTLMNAVWPNAVVEVNNLDQNISTLRKLLGASYDIATIHASLGDLDQTFTSLDRAFIDRSQLIGWLLWDEVFDTLRSDARYAQMLKRHNLPFR